MVSISISEFMDWLRGNKEDEKKKPKTDGENVRLFHGLFYGMHFHVHFDIHIRGDKENE